MLAEALRRFGPGQCTFFYLSDIDLQCHMLWRHGDPKTPGAPAHPGFDPQVSPRHAHHVEDFYRNADRLLGKVHAALPAGALLLAISDHGFQAQTRQFHLNAWLRDEGYLVLKQGTTAASISPAVKEGSHEPDFDSPDTLVDWDKTRAYGLGFNGLYLNLRGRETEGIVAREEAAALAEEIAGRLMQVRDPVSGQPVIAKVYRAAEIYSGPYVETAPDMIVGYNRGYRSSNKTALGEIPDEVLGDNREKWSGDHAMAAELVPGVVFANKKIKADAPALADLTVTVLAEFGIPPEGAMKGKPIF